MRVLQIDALTSFKEIFQGIFSDIRDFLPTVIGFIAFIIFSWLFIKFFLYVVKKILSKTKIDELSEKLSEIKIFGNTTIKVVLTKLIVNILKWFLIMIFVMAGSEMFGLQSLSGALKSFFAYLPRLITALAIFVAGVYLGTILKKTVQSMFKSLEINGGNLVGNVIFYLIVVFLSITALDQAGIDTSIIKSNLTMIIGSILLAFTIAFGLGARDAVSRLLFGYYSRKNIEIGSLIKFDGDEGVVVAIDNICLTLQTNDGKIILPVKSLVDNKVIVLKK